MPTPVTLEICVESTASAIAAQQGGAHRVELCQNLDVGGTTPAAEIIEQTRKSISIALHVMIRPRGGDFFYSEVEFAMMENDIDVAKGLKADGVVFGLLNPDQTIDRDRTELLVSRARPLSVTFHRAFDETAEPMKALEDVVACGADRILTSGQRKSAQEGIALIAKLSEAARNRTEIMAGAGITAENARFILSRGNVREIHIARASFAEGVVDGEKVRHILSVASSPERRR